MEKTIFKVTNHRGQIQATFLRRWQAEEFAEKYNYKVTVQFPEKYLPKNKEAAQ